MHLEDKRIVVTGGAGFLGSHLVELLQRKGCRSVHVPRSADVDFVNIADVRRYYAEVKPQVVFHLAARVGGIGANQLNPGPYFHDNLVMGVNVIEQGRLFGVEKTLLTGTVCSYPKFAPVPFREDDIWKGYPEETNAPYGIAKKALFVMADAYRVQYGVNTLCLLPVNLFGPRDNFDLESSHVIPAMVRKFVEEKERGTDEVVLWGDGSPTREFLYVEDCTKGLLLAAERYESSVPVNLGAGFEISMKDLAENIAQKVGFKGHVKWDITRPNGQPRRSLDTSRARESFGFSATTQLDDGLTKTINWYLANR